MAKRSGLGQEFYIGGHDLSGDVGSIQNAGSPRNTLEVTGLNKFAVERLLAHGNGDLTFQSWFNPDNAHVALSELPTSDVLALWCFSGDQGDVAASLNGKQINYDPTRGQDGSLSFTIQVLSNNSPLEWLTLLSAGQVTHGAAGSSSAKDDGAQSTAGAVFHLQLVSLASGTVTVTIDDSANGSDWDTLASFAAVAAAATPAAERITQTGTIRRHLRITTTGTFSNAVMVVAYRRGASVDDVDLS